MKSLSKKLTLVFTLVILVACGVLVVSAEIDLSKIRNQVTTIRSDDILDGYKTEVKSEVQAGIALVQNFYNLYQSGAMTEEEAKSNALDTLRAFRYGDEGDGYIWVDGTDYTLIMHPILPDQEGNNRKDLTDKNGVKIIQSIMKVADEGGFNEFWFTKADGKTVAPKVAYSKAFKEWNWVLTSGCYSDDIDEHIAASKNTATLNGLFRDTTVVLLVESVILVVIMIILSALIVKKLVVVLNDIKKTLQNVSEGDLTKALPEIKRKDEIGETARHTNKAIRNFGNIISDSKENSADVRSTSVDVKNMANSAMEATTQIATAIEGIASDATNQADAISRVMHKMNEMQDSTEEISQAVQDIDNSARDLGKKSNEMQEHIADMQSGSQEMTTEVENIATAIHETQDTIEKMSGIIRSIEEIAGETNLLALNASIEAARAGDAGRGFAVVADSIKSLSENTSTELGKITQIIGDLINKFRTCTDSIETVVVSNQNNAKDIEEVINSFEVLIQGVTLTSEKVSNINRVIDETVANIETVSSQIVDIQKGAESSAAASEQVTASSQELAALMTNTDERISHLASKADNLYSKLGRFRVN